MSKSLDKRTPVRDENLRILHGGVSPEQIEQSIEIACDGFAPKFAPYGVSRSAMLGIWREGFQVDCAYYALRGDRVVGVLGYSTQERHSMQFRLSMMRRHLPFAKALVGTIVLNIEKPIVPDELRIEPLAVAQGQRGQGVGSTLLRHLITVAPEQGLKLLSLEVIDTNVGALRLYKRFGFSVVSTSRTGWFTHRSGFDGMHLMHRHLDH